MNTQSIHNATFLNLLPTGYLEKARILVNWHEYNIFSDPSFTGVGNGVFSSYIMILMLTRRHSRLSNDASWRDRRPRQDCECVGPAQARLLHHQLQAAPEHVQHDGCRQQRRAPRRARYVAARSSFVLSHRLITAIAVDYAAAVVLEVRQTSGSSEPLIRFQFKNGTAEEDFSTYSMVFDGWDGSGDVPMSTFLSAFGPAAINTTADWCNVCGQTTLRGCSEALAAAADANVHSVHQKITPVGAGFLGAGLTAAVMLMGLGALLLLGVLTLGAGKFRRRSVGQRGTPSGSMVGDHKSRPGDVELAGPPSEVTELYSF